MKRTCTALFSSIYIKLIFFLIA
ncbi:TPA: DUF4760 domain-containing protein, partial [Legionella pneumophila subsp. pneumophila]|nr:DUF4760 domain-containing protein [Legionella pneumophila subsp. pneumophila]